MSRLWPHTPFAEDQRFSRTILYTHVLTRGLQTGALFGSLAGTSIFLLRRLQILKQTIPPTTFVVSLLRSAVVGTVVGTGLMVVGVPVRMHGKEEIEWQDRSWRLLENNGQVECDDWAYTGMALGLAGARMATGGLGWRGPIGGMGLGGMLGMFGYMGWRYGVQGGKHGEDQL